MPERRISDHIRSHVWAIVACFIAVMGTAVVASASESDGEPQAAKSAGPNKQIKKLKRKLAAFEQRLAALEGKPGPTIPASPTIPTSLPPTGPAGGDLTGTYPSPAIRANAVGAAEIGANAVGASEIGADAVGATEISEDSVGTSELLESVSFSDIGITDVLNVFDGSIFMSSPAGTLWLQDGTARFEEIPDPGNPGANFVWVYARQSGGLTQLVARFADGNTDILAVEAP